MAKRVRHSFTACLLATGWTRNNEPWGGEDEEAGQWGPGECTDSQGCIRPGRWTHPGIFGEYCAQHAHQGTTRRGWGGHS